MQEVAYKLEKIAGQPVLWLDPIGEPIAHERDAGDVVGEVFSHGAAFVVLPASRLSPDFFVLSTCLAGEVLQKFVTYGIGVVILGDIETRAAESEALAAFVRESNRGSQVWLLADRAALEARLAAD